MHDGERYRSQASMYQRPLNLAPGIPNTSEWLKRNNCFLARDDQRPATHQTVNISDRAGGRLHVPPELVSQFHDAYSKDIGPRSGFRAMMIERRTDVFKMLFDLDIKGDMSLEDGDALEVCREVLAATREYFDVDDVSMGDAIVCAIMNEMGEQRLPGGLHIITRYPVDKDQALSIRSGVLARLNSNLTDPKWQKYTWESIVDIAVLTSSGLRMIGSDKTIPCPKCHNRDIEGKKQCGTCFFAGMVLEGRVYFPWRCIPEEAEARSFSSVLSNLKQALKHTSIRIAYPEKMRSQMRFRRVLLAPASSRLTGTLQLNKFGLEMKTPQLEDDAAEKPSNGLIIAKDSIEFKYVLNAIRKYRDVYKDINISNIEHKYVKNNNRKRRYSNSNIDYYLVRVHGTGDTWCANKNSVHTSSRVYFILTPQGISQRCWCRKDIHRMHGHCKDFKGNYMPLSLEAIESLFPDATRREGASIDPRFRCTSLDSLNFLHPSDVQKAARLAILNAKSNGRNMLLPTPESRILLDPPTGATCL